jgi:hypothetical protein
VNPEDVNGRAPLRFPSGTLLLAVGGAVEAQVRLAEHVKRPGARFWERPAASAPGQVSLRREVC